MIILHWLVRFDCRVGFLPWQKVYFCQDSGKTVKTDHNWQKAKSLVHKVARNTLVWVCSICINCITVQWWTFWLVYSLRGTKVRVELDVTVSVGIMDRTRVRITIRIKEMVGVCSIITYSTLLLVCCNWTCAPKPQSCQLLFNSRRFVTLPTNFCLYVVKISLETGSLSANHISDVSDSVILLQNCSKWLESEGITNSGGTRIYDDTLFAVWLLWAALNIWGLNILSSSLPFPYGRLYLFLGLRLSGIQNLGFIAPKSLTNATYTCIMLLLYLHMHLKICILIYILFLGQM